MRRGREVHQLDLGYPVSSLSCEWPERHGGVLAGDRAPDALLQCASGQTRRLFDLLQGSHWTLIGYGGSTASLPRAGRDLHVHLIGDDGELHDEGGRLATVYGLADGDLLLIRPDGYVGAVVDAAHSARIADYLASRVPG